MRYSKQQSDELKLHVSHQAFELFAKQGIEAVSMQQIADTSGCGVASLYRYYGTKLDLVIHVASIKWMEYLEEVEALYQQLGGMGFTALEEFSFYLDSYIELYRQYPDILRFNANFDLYAQHEGATEEQMKPYRESVDRFLLKFHVIGTKAKLDGTLRSDSAGRELFFGVMYTMLTTAAKFSYGLIYPTDSSLDGERILQMQKQMFLAYAQNTAVELQ